MSSKFSVIPKERQCDKKHMTDAPIVSLVQITLVDKFPAETHMGLRETCLERGL